MQSKQPWWYRLALRSAPERCREIPEAQNPDRTLLRQVALISRRVYLQQFVSGEDDRYFHRHAGPVLAIGLRGTYVDSSLLPEGGMLIKRVRAPYVRYMNSSHAHRVTHPQRQCSIFVLLRRKQERTYTDGRGRFWPWQEHVKKQVERI